MNRSRQERMIILSCSRAWATRGRLKLPDTRPLQCGNGSKNETNGQICFVLFFCYSRLFTQHLLRLQILKLKGNI